MLLIQISLTLTKPCPAMPFYGGVLHGMVADKRLAGLLQMGTFMHLLPPPIAPGSAPDTLASTHITPTLTKSAPVTPSPVSYKEEFHFGVVIHPAQNVNAWLARFDQLCANGQLHLGGAPCRVAAHHCIDPGTLDITPPSQAWQHLRIDWLTPTLIATKQKIALGHHQKSPSLPSIVNSAIHRIARLDSAHAARLGYSKDTWRQTIQALHSTACSQDQSQFFSDSYQSRSSQHQSQRPLTGIIGHSVYSGDISPLFLQILQWGQWVGVGEGVSQGRGCYQMHALASNKNHD